MTQAATRASGWRRTAFRIVAALFGLVVAGLALPYVVGTWFAETEHHVHEVGIAAGSGVLVGVALLVAAWAPEEQICAFQQAVLVAAAGLVAGAISGDLVSGGWLIQAAGAAVLVVLHPARSALFERGEGVSWPMAVIALVGAIPATIYGLSQAELQRTGDPADPHVDLHHYSGMAAMAISASLCGLLASLRTSGWRFTAWMAGIAAALFGVAGITWPRFPGAEGRGWGWASIGFGVAYVAATEWQYLAAIQWPAREGGSYEGGNAE